jgi:hypothetical protein
MAALNVSAASSVAEMKVMKAYQWPQLEIESGGCGGGLAENIWHQLALAWRSSAGAGHAAGENSS